MKILASSMRTDARTLLLRRALIVLSQHDRIGRRDGFGNMMPSDSLIRDIRKELTSLEKLGCDLLDPEVFKWKKAPFLFETECTCGVKYDLREFALDCYLQDHPWIQKLKEQEKE